MAMTNNKAFRLYKKWNKTDSSKANKYISRLARTIIAASYDFLQDARYKNSMLVEVFNAMKSEYRLNRKRIRKHINLSARDLAYDEFKKLLNGRKTYFVYYANRKDIDGSLGYESLEACIEGLKADPRFKAGEYEISEYLQGTGDYIKSFDIDGKITII